MCSCNVLSIKKYIGLFACGTVKILKDITDDFVGQLHKWIMKLTVNKRGIWLNDILTQSTIRTEADDMFYTQTAEHTAEQRTMFW